MAIAVDRFSNRELCVIDLIECKIYDGTLTRIKIRIIYEARFGGRVLAMSPAGHRIGFGIRVTVNLSIGHCVLLHGAPGTMKLPALTLLASIILTACCTRGKMHGLTSPLCHDLSAMPEKQSNKGNSMCKNASAGMTTIFGMLHSVSW